MENEQDQAAQDATQPQAAEAAGVSTEAVNEPEREAAAEAGYLGEAPAGAEVSADGSAAAAGDAAAETEAEFAEEIEENQDMIDEGAPVEPETEPLLGAAEGDAAPSDDAAVAAEGEEGAASASESAEEAETDSEYRRRLREYTKELKKLPGEWYIIQSYSGYENKVKTNLDMRIQTLEVEDSIFDVVVPIEQAIELKDGKRKVVKRKLLPGYVLVRMEMNDAAWSVVRETPGVTSFVGNEGNATPVKHRDVAKFLMPKAEPAAGEAAKANEDGETVIAMPEEEVKPKVAHDYKVGEAVTILSGALASVSATINAIDPETGKIEALVSIFGRETPVELTADQIERII